MIYIFLIKETGTANRGTNPHASWVSNSLAFFMFFLLATIEESHRTSGVSSIQLARGFISQLTLGRNLSLHPNKRRSPHELANAIFRRLLVRLVRSASSQDGLETSSQALREPLTLVREELEQKWAYERQEQLHHALGREARGAVLPFRDPVSVGRWRESGEGWGQLEGPRPRYSVDFASGYRPKRRHLRGAFLTHGVWELHGRCISGLQFVWRLSGSA